MFSFDELVIALLMLFYGKLKGKHREDASNIKFFIYEKTLKEIKQQFMANFLIWQTRERKVWDTSGRLLKHSFYCFEDLFIIVKQERTIINLS